MNMNHVRRNHGQRVKSANTASKNETQEFKILYARVITGNKMYFIDYYYYLRSTRTFQLLC